MQARSTASEAHRGVAFEVWVAPHLEVMLRVGRTLSGGSWADAEDLVQDTLVRAFRAQDSFDGAHPRSWLLTILRRTHLNEVRRHRLTLVDAAELEHHRPAFGQAGRDRSAEDVITDELLDPALERALAELDPRFRVVVLLVDVDQLTYAEAAEVLEVPQGTIMSRLSRGRRRLRASLGDPSTWKETRR